MKKNIILLVLALSLLFAINSNVYAVKKPASIKTINELRATVKHNGQYKLPSTVTAIMSDGTKKSVKVNWNGSEVNTRFTGERLYYGTVSNYKNGVTLRITITPYLITYEKRSIHRLIGSELNLPQHVFLLLSDGSTKKTPVKWNTTNATTENTGNFTIKGTTTDSNKMNVAINVVVGKDHVGISGANLSNCGLMVKEDNWTYYANSLHARFLYKINTDRMENVKLLSRSVAFLTIYNDCLYFITLGNISDDYKQDNNYLYRMNKDGTGLTKITENKVKNFVIVNDWIYYRNLSDSDKLYKMKIDGSSDMKLVDANICELIFSNDWLYYTNIGDKSCIYRCRLDGAENTKINNDVSDNVIVQNNIVLYNNIKDRATYKVNLDGTDRIKITSDDIHSFVVKDDIIYYIRTYTDKNLYKVKIDGSGKEKLGRTENNSILFTFDNCIYYFGKNNIACRMTETGKYNATLQMELNSYIYYDDLFE